MKRNPFTHTGIAVFAATGLVWLVWQRANFAADSNADAPKSMPTAETSPEVAALQADIERLKGPEP